MKMLTTLLRRSLQVHIGLISLVYFPCFVLAIEPIGTIGQPRPEEHVFLSDEVILRVVRTHIQINSASVSVWDVRTQRLLWRKTSGQMLGMSTNLIH